MLFGKHKKTKKVQSIVEKVYGKEDSEEMIENYAQMMKSIGLTAEETQAATLSLVDDRVKFPEIKDSKMDKFIEIMIKSARDSYQALTKILLDFPTALDALSISVLQYVVMVAALSGDLDPFYIHLLRSIYDLVDEVNWDLFVDVASELDIEKTLNNNYWDSTIERKVTDFCVEPNCFIKEIDSFTDGETKSFVLSTYGVMLGQIAHIILSNNKLKFYKNGVVVLNNYLVCQSEEIDVRITDGKVKKQFEKAIEPILEFTGMAMNGYFSK